VDESGICGTEGGLAIKTIPLADFFVFGCSYTVNCMRIIFSICCKTHVEGMYRGPNET
jgi:hypothetical protein